MTTPSKSTDRILAIRMSTCTANELLSALDKSSNKVECSELFDLVIQGLNLVQTGKGGKVRIENGFAYFDADFWESKVYVNIRLKQDHWSQTECLRTVHTKLVEMGYTKENQIENVLFDNRMHIFIPYKKPTLLNP
jgi:hypothetical protein